MSIGDSACGRINKNNFFGRDHEKQTSPLVVVHCDGKLTPKAVYGPHRVRCNIKREKTSLDGCSVIRTNRCSIHRVQQHLQGASGMLHSGFIFHDDYRSSLTCSSSNYHTCSDPLSAESFIQIYHHPELETTFTPLCEIFSPRPRRDSRLINHKRSRR